jgi:hypothetical protein
MRAAIDARSSFEGSGAFTSPTDRSHCARSPAVGQISGFPAFSAP